MAQALQSYGVQLKMTIKLCLAAFAVGVLVESKPLRLASRLVSLTKSNVQKVLKYFKARQEKVDKVLDEKLSEDE